MLKFLDSMILLLKPGSVRLLYTDTDSFTFAHCRPLKPGPDCVAKQEKMEEWVQFYNQNFVLDESDPYQARRPGLMKVEFSVSNGEAFFLSPKCYSIMDHESNTAKSASKGVTKNEDFDHEDYRKCLYDDDVRRVEQTQFQMSKKNKNIEMVSTWKVALSALLTKLEVQEDNVTVRPLSSGGKLL